MYTIYIYIYTIYNISIHIYIYTYIYYIVFRKKKHCVRSCTASFPAWIRGPPLGDFLPGKIIWYSTGRCVKHGGIRKKWWLPKDWEKK